MNKENFDVLELLGTHEMSNGLGFGTEIKFKVEGSLGEKETERDI